MNLPLKKTLSAMVVLVTLLLAGLLILGFRQYQLQRHHQEIIRQTEQLLFQFSLVREQIVESVMTGRPGQFDQITRELEVFHANVTRITENTHISDEYKLTLVSQADIRGLALLLRTLEMPLTPEGAEHLNRVVRGLGERLRVFDRMVIHNANRQLLAFQVMVIGILALTVVHLVVLLFLGYRRLALPLFSLAGHIRAVKEGRRTAIPAQEGWHEVKDLALLVDDAVREKHLLARSCFRKQNYLAMAGEVAKLLMETKETASLYRGLNQALLTNSEFCLVWIGVAERTGGPLAVAAEGSTIMNDLECRECVGVLAADDGHGEDQHPALCALRSGKAVVCHEIWANLPKYSLRNTPLAGETFSCASLPLHREGEILGVVNLYSLEPESFSAEEMELLSRLLELTTLVLKEKQRSAEGPAPAVSVRTSKTSRAVGELALEINNLCNGIINYAQLLIDDLGARIPEEQNMLLDRIIKEGERIAALVDPQPGLQPEGPEPERPERHAPAA